MLRYLLNISYIGTPFKGVQRQVTAANGRPNDPSTVQGVIEMGLKTLRPVNNPIVILSSRTDSGVHCLNSAVHVDLQHHSSAYKPVDITVALNKFFSKQQLPVRILKTFLVPNSFHCRYNAISRTYLYRLAVIKSDSLKNLFCDYIPIEDYDRCLYIGTDKFDVDKAKEVAKLFLGTHDFRSFMGEGTKHFDKMTRRTVDRLDIFERRSEEYSCLRSSLQKKYEFHNYQYFDFVFTSSSFLNKQVRRTVASLIAVAKGIVTPKDIKFMLETPSHRSWNPRIKTVAPHGLYLCEVSYLKEDLHTFREDLNN